MPVLIIVILLFSVILHECAHGVVALFFGDDTAKKAGRLSLNVLRHIDPFGTVVLPLTLFALYMISGSGILFGWAKPVPINVNKFRNPARDAALVSVAGPLSNILLGIGFVLILSLSIPLLSGQIVLFSFIRSICFLGIKINMVLAMFNLLPIPPLDGSHLLAYLLPHRLATQYRNLAKYGVLIIVILMLADILDYPFLLADYFSKLLVQWGYRVGLLFLG